MLVKQNGLLISNGKAKKIFKQNGTIMKTRSLGGYLYSFLLKSFRQTQLVFIISKLET